MQSSPVLGNAGGTRRMFRVVALFICKVLPKRLLCDISSGARECKHLSVLFKNNCIASNPTGNVEECLYEQVLKNCPFQRWFQFRKYGKITGGQVWGVGMLEGKSLLIFGIKVAN